jgi:hypothetical protein
MAGHAQQLLAYNVTVIADYQFPLVSARQVRGHGDGVRPMKVNDIGWTASNFGDHPWADRGGRERHPTSDSNDRYSIHNMSDRPCVFVRHDHLQTDARLQPIAEKLEVGFYASPMRRVELTNVQYLKPRVVVSHDEPSRAFM